MKRKIPISEFKAKCIQLIKQAAQGEELVVTLRGEPLAKVVGISDTRQRILGGQRDMLEPGLSCLMESDLAKDWDS